MHFHTEGVPNKPLPAPSEAEKPVPFAMSIGLSVQRVLVQTFWAALENALGKKSTNPEVSPLLPLAEPGKMSEKAEQIIWFVDDTNVYQVTISYFQSNNWSSISEGFLYGQDNPQVKEMRCISI